MKQTVLTLAHAVYRATRFLRRTVDEDEIRSWLVDGLPYDQERDRVWIRRSDLDRYLLRIEAKERLMTITETTRRLLSHHGVCVTERTVRAWCDGGITAGGNRVYLRYVYSPTFSPSRRLIRPKDLASFVEVVGVKNLGKIGRPLGSGKA